MGGFSGFFWMMGLLPVLGIAAIAAAIWYGVKKAKANPAQAATEPPAPQEEALRKMAHIAYGLYAAAVLFPVTAVAGVILAYLKQNEAQGTWLATHFRWLIRTFWFMLLWSAIGMVLFFAMVGWLVFLVAALWYIYRVVLGWVSLAERRPMRTKGDPAPVAEIGQQG